VKLRRAVLLLMAAAACGKKEPAPAPAPSVLQQASTIVSGQGACSTLIPQEWSTSRPVPSKRGGTLHYRMFFFGRKGSPAKGFTFHAPQGEAAFTPDGRVLECRRFPGEAVAVARDDRFAAMTLDQIDALSARLHADTEAVAALYASGRDIGETGRARVAAFSRDFAALANPAHAAGYRALDPEFWAWVEQNGGAAPSPK